MRFSVFVLSFFLKKKMYILFYSKFLLLSRNEGEKKSRSWPEQCQNNTYPAFSDATIDMWWWGSLVSCNGERPERGTSGAIFCSVFVDKPATWNERKERIWLMLNLMHKKLLHRHLSISSLRNGSLSISHEIDIMSFYSMEIIFWCYIINNTHLSLSEYFFNHNYAAAAAVSLKVWCC